MPVCAASTVIWAYPNSSGNTRVNYTLFSPNPTADISTCSYVLASQAELGLSLDFLHLTMDEASQIAIAVIGVWAVAWVFRILVQFTRSHFSDSGE